MTLQQHPLPGTIIRVDLNEGFRTPEMRKRRPAIVLSAPIPGRDLLCTIVPLSTKRPRLVLPHHLRITLDPPLPSPCGNPTMWVKGDIVLTVAFHRLRFLFKKWDEGQRVDDVRVLDDGTMERVKASVRAGIGV
ncbi:type II toxin-antitoxin system PemK/MazF family toxin [Ferruginivarius sediminum]|uniref:type II toxin-antitoxin system PemK/MazF family toxin n=1 Tax=Ferruginivarius sediminum TaxID=2661937 RepID=UPI00137B183D|nr:type II toxin-antitoxin system PemK/MazF family toxin [Ferruginivarius sediminum]